MKKVLLILFAISALSVHGQWADTTVRHNLPPLLTGSVMVGTGALVAFQPDVNSIAVALRDGVMSQNLPKLHFDNYIQYLPAIAPAALKFAGLKNRHTIGEILKLEGASYLLGAGWLGFGKYRFAVLRPDGSSYNSFPSGHSFMAFTGAELLRREYGRDYPWVAVAGYAVAITVGLMRIYNNRHWAGDVLAGAGLGIMSVSLAYWVLD